MENHYHKGVRISIIISAIKLLEKNVEHKVNIPEPNSVVLCSESRVWFHSRLGTEAIQSTTRGKSVG